MEQLGLFLSPRLSYEGANYVLHEGAAEVITSINTALNTAAFQSIFIYAPSRFGKTHTSVKIVDLALKSKKYPHLVEGLDLKNVHTSGSMALIIDDIDHYLAHIQKGESGNFVNIWESVRQREGTIVMFSSIPFYDFECDDHIRSRLQSAIHLSLEAPGAQDISAIITSMAVQRGLKLDERKIEFLSRRIRRDIPSLERYFERLIHLSQLFGEKVKFNMLGDALSTDSF